MLTPDESAPNRLAIALQGDLVMILNLAAGSPSHKTFGSTLSVVAGHDTNLICGSLDKASDCESEEQEFESLSGAPIFLSTYAGYGLITASQPDGWEAYGKQAALFLNKASF